MHEVIAEVAGNLIPVDVSVSAGEAIPVEVGGGSGGGGGGLSNAAKDALLQIARKVVYVDAGGATYYNALYEALYPLSGITAVYTQSGTVYDTDTLDDLIPDLVVTATYGGGGTATVPAADYTLSGTLAVGTSTVTVTYEGKTATFTVTVSSAPATLSYIEAVYVQGAMVIYDTDPLSKLNQGLTVEAYYSDGTVAELTVGSYTLSGTLTPGTSTITVTYQDKTDTFTVTVTASGGAVLLYSWDLTQSATDSVSSATASGNASRDSSGLHFTQSGEYFDFGAIYALGRVYEIDVITHDQKTGSGITKYGRIFGVNTSTYMNAGAATVCYTGSTRTGYPNGKKGWGIYLGSAWDSVAWGTMPDAAAGNDYNDAALNGKTLRVIVDETGHWTLSYKTIGADDSTYQDLATTTSPVNTFVDGHVIIGGSTSGQNTDWLYNTTIAALRVYTHVRTILYSWDLTASATDSIGSVVSSGTASRDSSGLHFTENDTYWDFGEVYDRGRTYEVDILSHEQNGHGGTNAYGRLFAVDTDSNTATGGACFIYTGSKRTANTSGKAGYAIYVGTTWDSSAWSVLPDAAAGNNYNDSFFDGKTVRIQITTAGFCRISYKTIGADDSTYVTVAVSAAAFKTYSGGHVYIGSSGTTADFLQQTTITGLRIYEGAA